MNQQTRLWSVLFLSIATSFLMASCQSEPKSEEKVLPVDRPLVPDAYKLSADRQAFSEIREQVPSETQQKNDELAFSLEFFNQETLPPDRIREKFNLAVTKKREKMNKDFEKRRETFVRSERKAREEFTKEQRLSREEFSKSKHPADERKEFFDDLEVKRKDFYVNQKESRDAFEADMRDDRKNFEDYLKQKQNDFLFQMKNYEQKYRKNQGH